MLMMMIHSRRCRAIRLCLLVSFTGLLTPARRTEILWFPLDPGDTGARGTVVSQRLRAQRKRKTTLQILTGTMGRLVVLMEEMVQFPSSGAFAAFHAIRRGGTRARRLLHQQFLAHHTPSTVRGELTFSYSSFISRHTERSSSIRAIRTRDEFALCITRSGSYALPPITFYGIRHLVPFSDGKTIQ